MQGQEPLASGRLFYSSYVCDRSEVTCLATPEKLCDILYDQLPYVVYFPFIELEHDRQLIEAELLRIVERERLSSGPSFSSA